MLENFTFLLGVASILQMLILPGLLVIRCCSISVSRIHSLLTVVVLSLLVNFWLVLVLTLCGAYSTVVLRIIVGIEVIGLLLCYWSWLKACISIQVWRDFWHSVYQPCRQITGSVRWYYLTIFWLGVFTLGYFVWIWLHSFGWTFAPWDPAVSWNPWALQWSQGHLPTFTYHYPQLLPANWSLSYVLLGSVDGTTQLEAFPHAIMGCFPLLILLSLVVLYQQTRQFGYWLALTLTGATLWLLMRAYFNLGYADIAATSLVFFALTQLILANDKAQNAVTYVWLGTMAVAAAALTKQVALTAVVLYPILSWLLVWRHQGRASRSLFAMLLQWVVLIALIAPWYGIAQWMIQVGLNGSEVHYVTHTIYRHTGWQERLLLGWHFATGWYWLMFVMLTFLGWQVKAWRAIFWWVAVPTTLIWLAWFDYDSRNLTLALPIVCTTFALLWQQQVEHGKLSHGLALIAESSQRVRYYEMVIMVLLALGVLGFMAGFQARDIAHDQAVQKRHIANEALDKTLYEYLRQHPLQGKILTAWPFLSQMPVLNHYVQHLDHRWYGADMLPDTFQDVATLKAALQAFPEVKYILSYNRYPMMGPSVKQYLAHQVTAGHLTVLWTVSAFTFYQIQ